jgi:glycine betaine/proline transport system permease protein
VIIAVWLGAWRIGKGFALFALLASLYIIYSGYSEHAAVTLALTLSSTFFSLLIGIPLGICRRDARLPAGSFARCLIYADHARLCVPDTRDDFVRASLPAGDLRDDSVFYAAGGASDRFRYSPGQRRRIEAGIAFGCTPWQLLWKVQLPAAQPSIMAGINQSIMMAMSMVIIASMVGAGGLGNDILSSIQQLEIGTGLQSGFVVVLIAIPLDRLSASFARRDGPWRQKDDASRAVSTQSEIARQSCIRNGASSSRPRQPGSRCRRGIRSPLQERFHVADAFAQHHRGIFGQVDNRGRLLAQIAAVDNQVHQLLQTIFDLFRVGFGKVAAGQHQRGGQHRFAERLQQRLAIGFDGTRMPMVLRFSCSRRRGTSLVPLRIKV